MATQSASTEVLSKHCDVILRVGTPQTERKLFVSSALLSHSSPVFAAMFDGRFGEGQDLSADSPRAVPLPEDDADAVTTVCKIIHVQVAGLAVTASPTQLVSIAMVAHKYDCVEAVRPWSIIWVADILQKPGVPDFEKTLLATCLLDMAPEFQGVSKSLIRDRSEVSISAISNGEVFLSIPILERVLKAQIQTQYNALATFDAIIPLFGCKARTEDMAFFFKALL
ncbi:uncharacterized protein M421DRAFT_6679 [Didymella exigua CBS 183.55]|uniref:BTB domain-containing protein n=1 Tax=Didymella exigua CBS 183.55 TaxID=1150837 RepID=A0A6A5REQ1_9PLEO|nr:uncharacterized protein M421DRAFT_6679 [Didymella exigua CBS 183.55]KAF1926771.1 hypothetical protein M421DRAFT_6679 [Didymella exigua CBS 183.55]